MHSPDLGPSRHASVAEGSTVSPKGASFIGSGHGWAITSVWEQCQSGDALVTSSESSVLDVLFKNRLLLDSQLHNTKRSLARKLCKLT